MLSHLSPVDTIAALASAPGGAARGIVRVSGRNLLDVLKRVYVPADADAWNSRGAARHDGTLNIQGLGSRFPAALYFWPGSRSYTGEPLAEFHLAGSPPILEAVLATLAASGARLAQPGEFTLRAFLAGRIDLLQAEGVLGVIDADSTTELKTALAQLAGGASNQIATLRGQLLDLLADLEAGLDFADEKLDFVSHAAIVDRLQDAREKVSAIAKGTNERQRSAARWRVTLAGPPNAGKSTLFNALIGRAAAIVSEQKGTTRDYLEADVTLENLPITLCDTAGHSESADGPDSEAQEQRRRQLEQADLILDCSPMDAAVVAEKHDNSCGTVLTVLTKADLPGSKSDVNDGLRVSARDGSGLQELRRQIIQRLQSASAGERQFVGTTAARCAESLRRAAESLDHGIQAAEGEADQVLLAMEIRDALDALGEIVGAVYTDDLLDRVFSKFCIGK